MVRSRHKKNHADQVTLHWTGQTFLEDLKSEDGSNKPLRNFDGYLHMYVASRVRMLQY